MNKGNNLRKNAPVREGAEIVNLTIDDFKKTQPAIQAERLKICPKYESCSAPICLLDPDWNHRETLKGERICFYMGEYAKPSTRPLLRGRIPSELWSALARVFPAAKSRYTPLKLALMRAEKTGSRLNAFSTEGKK